MIKKETCDCCNDAGHLILEELVINLKKGNKLPDEFRRILYDSEQRRIFINASILDDDVQEEMSKVGYSSVSTTIDKKKQHFIQIDHCIDFLSRSDDLDRIEDGRILQKMQINIIRDLK